MFANYKEIIFQSIILTKANLKSRYRNSFAGYLWVIISPISTYLTQSYVFKFVFKVQVENYLLFLLLGLIPWIFFAQTIEMTVGALFCNAKLLKSFQLQPVSIIIAQVFDNLINNLTVIVIILSWLFFFQDVNLEKIYLFPLPYISLGIFTFALSFLFSALSLLFFDVKFIISFLLGLLFLISPILYPESFVPEKFIFLIKMNPLYYIFKPFKDLISGGADILFFKDLCLSFCESIAMLTLTFLFWRKNGNDLLIRI